MSSKDAAKAEKEAMKAAKEAAKEAAKAEKEAAKEIARAEKEAAKAEKTAAKDAVKQQREEERAVARQEKAEQREEREAARLERLAQQQANMEAEMEAGRAARREYEKQKELENIAFAMTECEKDETMSRSIVAEYEQEARVRLAHERLAKEGRLAGGVENADDDELTRQAKKMERLVQAIALERSRPKVPVPEGRVHLRARNGRYLSNDRLTDLTHSSGVHGTSETFALKDVGCERRELRALFNGKVASFNPAKVEFVNHRDDFSTIELCPSSGGFWIIKCVKSGEYVKLESIRSVVTVRGRGCATEFEVVHATN